MKIVINRVQKYSKSIIGELFINDEFFCYTLELPYRSNKNFKSCIKAGHYQGEIVYSQKFGTKVIRFDDKNNRKNILIHYGNFPEDTDGCIIAGDRYSKNVVGNSRKTLEKLIDRLRGNEVLAFQINNKIDIEV